MEPCLMKTVGELERDLRAEDVLDVNVYYTKGRWHASVVFGDRSIYRTAGESLLEVLHGVVARLEGRARGES